MTGVELVVGGWFASAFIGKLADKVRSYIGDQYEYQTTNIKDKLESLEGNMNKIQAAIHAAEQRGIENPGLKQWLLDLKDACYDAEDVLDLFEYQLLEDKAKKKSQGSRSFPKMRKLSKDVRVTVKRFLFDDDNLNELFEVVDRFDKLVNQIGGFLQLLSFDHGARDRDGERSEIMERRSTDSDFKEPKLFGRDTEKTLLIELLLEKRGDEVGPSRELLHVLPMVGIGGMGKTTLAQSVYNEQSVKNFFDLTAWVCVSDKWELRRLMVEIIESAKIKTPPGFHDLRSLDRIRQILEEGLMGKRFLLVLDDVWNEEPDKWEKLRSALESSGKDGSKIIVTTRNHKIADMMGTKKAISLGGLADKEYWQYFVHCAFGRERPENHPNLKYFAERIVKKLGGLPLAAKVIGGVLKSSLKERHWKEISESKWWQVDQSKDQIMPVLRLSYDYLPAHLKQCFVYCSLFPKDYCFSVKQLVWLWMAQGYIQDKENKTMENTGDDYFKELLSRSFFEEYFFESFFEESFFEESQGSSYEYEYKYVIHDLLHDLAQSLSDGESFTADDYLSNIKPEDIPKKVRHIYTSANNLPVVCNDKYAKKNLRSLVVSGQCDISLDILEELEGLRVLLILDGVRTSSLPECFQKMLHLRYLEIFENRDSFDEIFGNEIFGNEIFKNMDSFDEIFRNMDSFVLPQSLGKLYHLQVLSLCEMDHFNLLPGEEDCSFSFPTNINSLINLRHLYAPTEGIAGIGTLTSLQELKFSVKKENGFEIWQLRDMSQLTELAIRNLVNVKSKEQASEARLRDKRNLKRLRLYWGEGSHSDPGGVLEGLEPPKNLEHLVMVGFNGKCPSWWNGNWLSHLNYIELDDFSSWEILPPFGHLPLLRELHLFGMNGVKRIGPEFYGSNNTTTSKPSFPLLERLVLVGMSELVEWYKPEGEGIQPFPRLSFLEVWGCPNLRGPLCLPSHYKELRVHPWRSFWSGHEEGIYLFGCPSFSRLMEWIPMQNLASLEMVHIRSYEITSFTTEQEEWFQHLTSIQLLDFSDCEKLQSLPSILGLSTLRELKAEGCFSLKSLPEEGLPTSLKRLSLSGIHRVLKERCSEGGLDWHKISHIPEIILIY